MYKPNFTVNDIGGKCYTINDNEKTVAVISSQGIIDWLLHFTVDRGETITELKKEPHLSYINGFKIELVSKTPATFLSEIEFELTNGQTELLITAVSYSDDNTFKSVTKALLYVCEEGSLYQWKLDTTITSIAERDIAMNSVEYNNLYPHGVGRCMLFEREKLYSHTLIEDKSGDFWAFPHQHAMHYSAKIEELGLQGGNIAGFFGEPCPEKCYTVQVTYSNAVTDWAICDMYYDLHCLLRVADGVFKPGNSLTAQYIVTAILPSDADNLLSAAKQIPVNEDNLKTHDYPSIHLGFNSCTERVKINDIDDSSYFRPNPPVKVWDKKVGCKEKGSLRITNEEDFETVWSIEPPTQIPEESTLNITAYIKTEGVVGKGAYIRMNYFTFVWHPEPHCEWAEPILTEPINGTQDWIKVTLPELKVPKEHFDYLINLELVLDGKGIAWFTDFDLDLKYKAKSNFNLRKLVKTA